MDALMDQQGIDAMTALTVKNIEYTRGFQSGFFSRSQTSLLVSAIVPHGRSLPSGAIIPHDYFGDLVGRSLPIGKMWSYGFRSIADRGMSLNPISPADPGEPEVVIRWSRESPGSGTCSSLEPLVSRKERERCTHGRELQQCFYRY